MTDNFPLKKGITLTDNYICESNIDWPVVKLLLIRLEDALLAGQPTEQLDKKIKSFL